MIFSYQVRGRPDGVCVLLSGEIDWSVREELRSVLDDVVAASPGVTDLDLRDLTFLDCSGIGVFMRAYTRAHGRGRAVTVRRPHGVVRRVLEMTGSLSLLTLDHESLGPGQVAVPVAPPLGRDASHQPEPQSPRGGGSSGLDGRPTAHRR